MRVIVMGVSGCGKTTVGPLLADRIAGTFLDGDDLHPQSNVAKMTAGIPLTDADREPWLHEVGARLAAAPGTLILGCSALRRMYRDTIRAVAPDTLFVHLHGSSQLLAARMSSRTSHFMPTALLDSQLTTLEHLETDECGTVLDVAQSPADLATAAAEWILDTSGKQIRAMDGTRTLGRPSQT